LDVVVMTHPLESPLQIASPAAGTLMTIVFSVREADYGLAAPCDVVGLRDDDE
jgi:hypothetical protein